ncbi:hypothetical protein [Rhodococcoides fascians]|uniref:hypothetical protein n=1 Tax=Rhodococcoides fascians TaxID=1828 RepID=UPI00050C3C55|nr:hypothetical protein [Rhodococcus fascians]
MTTLITVKLSNNATYAEYEALIDTLKQRSYIDEFIISKLPKTEVYVAPKPAFDPKAPTINEAVSAALTESMDALFDHLGIDPKTAQSYVDPHLIAREALTRLRNHFSDRLNALEPHNAFSSASERSVLAAEVQSAYDLVRRELTALPVPAEEPAEGKHAA